MVQGRGEAPSPRGGFDAPASPPASPPPPPPDGGREQGFWRWLRHRFRKKARAASKRYSIRIGPSPCVDVADMMLPQFPQELQARAKSMVRSTWEDTHNPVRRGTGNRGSGGSTYQANRLPEEEDSRRKQDPMFIEAVMDGNVWHPQAREAARRKSKIEGGDAHSPASARADAGSSAARGDSKGVKVVRMSTYNPHPEPDEQEEEEEEVLQNTAVVEF